MLLTKIPFYREIVLMSFYCDHCHFANNEVQPAAEIQEKGSKYTFRLDSSEDLQRQVVKSDSAILRVEDVDLELPAGRGRLTDVEGILSEILKDFEAGQKARKKDEPELYEKIEKVLEPILKALTGSKFPLTISLDDPAGNSWIEPSATDATVKTKYLHDQYPRSQAQNASLGFSEAVEGEADAIQLQPDEGGGMEDVEILEGKVYDIAVYCPGCNQVAKMLTQMVNIPHFKQVILTTTVCDDCGYKTNDVKTGGAVPEKGKRIWLDVKDPKDLGRDILKSETCVLSIPECEVTVQPGTMGGRFTTVEGLLTQIRDDLKGSIFGDEDDKTVSDSMPAMKKAAWDKFFGQLEKAIKCEIQYTILMEDPLANSYCQNFDVPGPGNDPQLRSEEYERTEEEEDDLGMTHMKTELNEHGEYVREAPQKSTDKLASNVEPTKEPS